MAQAERQGLLHPERLKWFRNLNVLGAVALAGAGLVVSAHQELLFLGAGANTAQAAGAEVLRQRQEKENTLN